MKSTKIPKIVVSLNEETRKVESYDSFKAWAILVSVPFLGNHRLENYLRETDKYSRIKLFNTRDAARGEIDFRKASFPTTKFRPIKVLVTVDTDSALTKRKKYSRV